jgi:hypothetical protein
LPPDEALIKTIDARLNDWNQGDVVLGAVIPFVYLADYTQPITSGSQTAAAENSGSGENLGTVAVDAPGIVIITQSCDLIRSCREQPFVKVAILQEVESDFLAEVKKGRRPRYAYIPAVADRHLLANLDAMITMEKSVFAAINLSDRIRGCRTDAEIRELAFALSRNLDRFAFPDDFTAAMKSIQGRILAKHGKITRDDKGKQTNEGSFLTRLREIRVACAPSWLASDPNLTFYFIFNSRDDIPSDGDEIVETLLSRFKPTGQFNTFSFRLVTLAEISAQTYVSSEPLDLEYLTHSLDE